MENLKVIESTPNPLMYIDMLEGEILVSVDKLNLARSSITTPNICIVKVVTKSDNFVNVIELSF